MLTETFQFSAEPRAVHVQVLQKEKARYREPVNIMVDKRVIRGSTYQPGLQVIGHAEIPPPPVRSQGSESARMRLYGIKPPTPPPATHFSALVQTDQFLEELDPEIYESDAQTQTEASAVDKIEGALKKDKIAHALYVSRNVGVDASTHIEEGALFNYERSVESVLCVIVGKALDQATFEVRHENEMQRLRQQKAMFEYERTAALLETQRLEAESVRKFEEKQRRLTQARQKDEFEQSLKLKAVAAAEAEEVLKQLADTALTNFTNQRVLVDRSENEVRTIFMPALINSVNEIVSYQRNAYNQLTTIVYDTVISYEEARVAELTRRETEARLIREAKEAAEAAELARIAAEEAEHLRLAEEARIAAQLEAERLAAEENQENEAGEADEEGEAEEED